MKALKALTFWGTTKKCGNKNLSSFFLFVWDWNGERLTAPGSNLNTGDPTDLIYLTNLTLIILYKWSRNGLTGQFHDFYFLISIPVVSSRDWRFTKKLTASSLEFAMQPKVQRKEKQISILAYEL